MKTQTALFTRPIGLAAIAAGFGATMLAISPVGAQNQPDQAAAIGNSPLIGKLETCTAIVDNIERLACFDREVGALVGAANEGDVKVVQTEDITQARRRLFGFSLPKVGLFGDGRKKRSASSNRPSPRFAKWGHANGISGSKKATRSGR